jgi:hypothetical protein
MKIQIGPYRSWIGPYQLAEKLKYLGFSEDTQDKVGDWLAKTWVNKFCSWTDSKRKRKIKIKLHPYDTWGMDNTLAHIIHPMLVQLKEQKHGSPLVDDEDVPPHLRSTTAPPKENDWDTDDNHHLRWDWVLDELIWTFNEIKNDVWEDQYWSGNMDIHFEDGENGNKILQTGPNHTRTCDFDAMKKHGAKIDNGLRLFGKYYNSLWS